MSLPQFFVSYFVWHYTKAYAQLFRIWRNYFRFILQFFSVGLLLKTLFAPWKRIVDVYQGGFHIEEYFTTLVVNFFSRIVGFIIRVPLIIIGLVLSLCMVVGLVLLCVYWTLFPVIVFGLIVTGFSFLYV